MGDQNQLKWVEDNFHLIQPPILEIGARHYAPLTAIDYRGLCKGMEFIGVDMSEGNNVDIVINLTEDFSIIEEKLKFKKFKTIICCSVLEHVDNLFKMVQNISQLIEPEGVLFVSVPFSWRFHGYPNDYWRFTPEGIKYLFPEFTFKQEISTMSSINIGNMIEIADNPNDFNSLVTKSLKNEVVLPSPTPKSKFKRFLKKVFFTEEEKIDKLRYPYLIVPTNINMIGIKT